MLLPAKFETPQPAIASCVRKQYAPLVLKFPDWPPERIFGQSMPPLVLLLLEELELLLELLELLELLDVPELEELEDDELLLLDELLELPPVLI